MANHILLDNRFQELTDDQRKALRHVYRWDRKRGWAPNDTRYFVNSLIDHQVAHNRELKEAS